MRTVKFGMGGPEVSVIGQGTWYIEQARRADAVAALRRGVELGLTHIDTAEMYGNGAAEEFVGTAIEGQRERVFLVSKVLPWNASHDGVIEACEGTLSRLGTDHLDCYLLHWRGQHPLEDTFAAMDRLRRDGKIRSFGVSNFDVDDLEEAIAIVGQGQLACNQVLYHLETRAIEHEVLPYCATHGIAVVGYSPFGHDSFPTPRSSGWPALTRIAQEHGASERQVALAYLTRESHVLLIPKASQSAHVEDNAGGGRIALSSQQIEEIDAAFPRGRKPRHLPML
ncbi:MAG: aldo/keto reductase [Alphaproteobacteria bacterium]|nr:aldo/keto reductase [Alphaproteobacteria bacterium]